MDKNLASVVPEPNQNALVSLKFINDVWVSVFARSEGIDAVLT